MSETINDKPERRMFPALRLMERTCPPNRHGRPPYWRAPVVPPTDDVYVPSWNWETRHELPQGTETLTLDVNGAWIGAIGNAVLAHSHLTRAGVWHHPDLQDLVPGYYRITVPYWAFSNTIVSPLGNAARAETENELWVAAPTLKLLLELDDAGYIGGFDVTDSYIARTTTTFRAWSARLKAEREACLDARESYHPDGRVPDDCDCVACRRYDALKQGYGSAITMMLAGERCATHRPDWAHTVYATHAANTWRKAWNYTFTGDHLVGMAHVDEMTITRAGLKAAMDRVPPPFRMDDTGRALGALKVKRTGAVGETQHEDAPERPAPASYEVPKEDENGDWL